MLYELDGRCDDRSFYELDGAKVGMIVEACMSWMVGVMVDAYMS